MIKLILMLEYNAGSYRLAQINKDYNLMNHSYCFGELSKTNVFIGMHKFL